MTFCEIVSAILVNGTWLMKTYTKSLMAEEKSEETILISKLALCLLIV